MAIDKPSLNDFLPNGFETQDKDGYKVNFDADKISAGYDKDTLEILSGPNLNNLLDNVGKNTHVLEQFLTFFRDMPIGSFPITNASNQLDYKSVNSFFRNVGELVFSAIPLEDGNLRLLDGSLLEYTMTYSRFITYIAGLRASLPNLFCTEQEFNQSVATYGVCGKFVYDTETKSLRLPKISGFVQGTLDSNSLGNVVEAGLPNITGHFYSEIWGGNPYSDGAFEATEFNCYRGGSANDAGRQWSFNASRSSSIYGNSTTVQPQAIKEFIYMVVSIDEAERQVLSAVYNYKGSVPTYADLPEAVAIGEVYNVIGEDPEGYSGANFAWTGEEWDRLGGTVNLSGYLPRTDAANTYATKASLESNVENLQEQINTNATNIANIASQEVIDQGIRKIEMLKFASTLGIGKVADTDLFNQILDMKRSSFDLTKFSKNGSPTITKDGVVSGFSTTNAIKHVLSESLSFATDNFKIKVRIKTNDVNSSQNIFNLKGNYLVRPYVDMGGSGKIYFKYQNSSGTDLNATLVNSATANTIYDFTFNCNNGVLDIYTNGTLTNTIDDIKSDYVVNGFYTLFAQTPFSGEIDLKYLYFEKNGQEIFNGNKQGMDIIKADDFIIRAKIFAYNDGNSHIIYADDDTTPTVLYNSDGSKYIGSDFTISEGVIYYDETACARVSGSDLILTTDCDANVQITNDGLATFRKNTLLMTDATNIKTLVEAGASLSIMGSFIANPLGKYTCLFDFGTSPTGTLSNGQPLAYITAENKLMLVIRKQGYNTYTIVINVNPVPNNFIVGQKYYFEFKYEVSQNIIFRFYDKDHSLIYNPTLQVADAPLMFPDGGWLYINTAYNKFGQGVGTFDLNDYKVLVNNIVEKQPLLRIPYNLSKTGLKITDKLDRAIDLGEQCGFSQYYGIDENNLLCLVPQGENITGRRDLVSREEDANHNVIEIYSDFYCKQSGSGTASTAVTFAIPYKDDNTVKMSCPYSAKSKTGFTPTADCDWTAEGYIYLDEVI